MNDAFSLPLLTREDMEALDAALGEFVAAGSARLALFIDCNGFVVTRQGDAAEMDITALAALAAASFAATQAIGKIIDEDAVTSFYQEGEENSLLMLSVGDAGFLTAVFAAKIGVGSVKFYAQEAVTRIERQMERARGRAPAEGLSGNLIEAGPLFRRAGR